MRLEWRVYLSLFGGGVFAALFPISEQKDDTTTGLRNVLSVLVVNMLEKSNHTGHDDEYGLGLCTKQFTNMPDSKARSPYQPAIPKWFEPVKRK